jgi:glucan 1,3-beta-glucosidase
MQAEVQQFSALLQSLNLTAGLFKPTPTPPLLSALGNGSSFDPLGIFGNTSIASSDPLGFDVQGNCSPERYSAPPVTDQEFPPFDSAKAAIFRYRQQQSVNLGSWLVVHL